MPVRAMAEARLALVIGNGAYVNVAALRNPVNDAILMADSLRKVGFDVKLITEARQDELIRAISDFGRKLRGAGDDATGLFYYAGHGVQSFGSNFLLPVDIALQDAADLSLVGVPAQAVLRQMFSARNKTNIVILDACRNNPFVTIPDLSDNGLAEIKAPRGTFLAYSTAPGDVAVDGTGKNSPFTEALATHLSAPGVPIEALFKDVRVEVVKLTGGKQTPWDTSSLTVDFQFVPAKTPTPEEIQMRQLWESVHMSHDPVQVLLFLRANPGNIYADDARALLRNLMAQALQPEKSSPDAETGTREPEGAQAQAPPEPEAEPGKPAPVNPVQSERDLIEQARQAGTADAYQAYLDAYPEGAFAELARLELKTIREKGPRTDPISKPPEPIPHEQKAPAATASTDMPDTVAFNAPLGIGDPELATRSIAEVIKGSPRFPPVENLPDIYWKDKHCTNCHHWNQENLCTQAKTYLADRKDALGKKHPLGGAFKQALAIWARDGCK
ncbi:caspase family protein [Roseibium aggregatum]|uniref:Caspase family protein n=1 Tax=Roseibium aggregatum TaxID=187304 RepID=A0A926S5C4_9HYPH|nr:caspase family protein [Roseibium aggregatum]MBD1546010.1 caspase family protein [Roseibium aggregatum]